jgi:CheY-like chemotaxis protein
MTGGADGAPDALEGLRILLVEDEMMIAMLLKGALNDLGCVVIGPAGRLPEAIRLAEAEAIDGALLDLNIDGDEVYAAAGKLAERGIPFAFITGYRANHLKEPYIDRPILQKPFTAPQLEKVLRALVRDIPA